MCDLSLYFRIKMMKKVAFLTVLLRIRSLFMPGNVDDNSCLTGSVYQRIYRITHVVVSNDCPF